MKKMNKTLQDQKMEIEAVTKIQTEGRLKMINLGIWTGTREASFNNCIHQMKKIILGTDDTVEEMDSLVKKNVDFFSKKKKTPDTNHPGNLERY